MLQCCERALHPGSSPCGSSTCDGHHDAIMPGTLQFSLTLARGYTHGFVTPWIRLTINISSWAEDLGPYLLEGCDGGLIQVAAPVEGGRAVVRQHLAGELGMDGLGKLLGLRQVRRGGLHPQQICEWGVCQPAGYGCLRQAAAYAQQSVKSSKQVVSL
jgi:hypothetical protein